MHCYSKCCSIIRLAERAAIKHERNKCGSSYHLWGQQVSNLFGKESTISRKSHIYRLKISFYKTKSQDGDIRLELCKSEEMIADVLTKGLNFYQFAKLRNSRIKEEAKQRERRSVEIIHSIWTSIALFCWYFWLTADTVDFFRIPSNDFTIGFCDLQCYHVLRFPIDYYVMFEFHRRDID